MKYSVLPALDLILIALGTTASAQGPRKLVPRHVDLAAVAISSDGGWVATCGSSDRTMKIMRSDGERAVVGIAPGTPSYSALAFSPDGQSVAASAAGHLRIDIYPTQAVWETWTSTEVSLVDSARAAVAALDFSPDGALLAAAGADSVTLWHVRNAALSTTLVGPRGVRTGVRFGDSGVVYAAGIFGIERWTLATGDRAVIVPGSSGVRSVDVSLDDSVIVTACSYGVIAWSAATGDSIRAYGDFPDARDARFASSDTTIVARYGDGRVRIWHRESGELIAELATTAPITSLDVSAAGVAVTDAANGEVRTWRTRDGAGMRELLAPHRFRRAVMTSSFSYAFVETDLGIVLADSWRGYLSEIIIDAHGPFAVIQSLDRLAAWSRGRIVIVQPFERTVLDTLDASSALRPETDLAWSRDGRFLASAGDTLGRVHVWSGDGELLQVLPTTERAIASVRFSRADDRLIALGEGGRLAVWRTDTWEPVQTIDVGRVAKGPSALLAVLDEPSRVAVGGASDTLSIIDIESGTTVHDVAFAARVVSVSFGGGLHVGTADGRVHVVGEQGLPYEIEWYRYPVASMSIALDDAAYMTVIVTAEGSASFGPGIGYTDSAPLAEESVAELTVDPQPASTTLRLTGAFDAARAIVTIVDVLGTTFDVTATALGSGRLGLDLSAMPSGLYLAVVRDGDRTMTTQFVVRR
jgi:WD40 repeat protein